jgi:hypothetical protein
MDWTNTHSGSSSNSSAGIGGGSDSDVTISSVNTNSTASAAATIDLEADDEQQDDTSMLSLLSSSVDAILNVFGASADNTSTTDDSDTLPDVLDAETPCTPTYTTIAADGTDYSTLGYDGATFASSNPSLVSSYYRVLSDGTIIANSEQLVEVYASETPTSSGYVDTVDSEADTKMYLQADGSKLIVSVPTQVHVKVTGDGSFITPTADAAAIKNGSIFRIHLADVTASSVGSFSFDPDDENGISYTLTPSLASASAISDINGKSIAQGWNIAKKDDSSDVFGSLGVQHSGSINNVTIDLGADQQFGTLNWVFSAGDYVG